MGSHSRIACYILAPTFHQVRPWNCDDINSRMFKIPEIARTLREVGLFPATPLTIGSCGEFGAILTCTKAYYESRIHSNLVFFFNFMCVILMYMCFLRVATFRSFI